MVLMERGVVVDRHIRLLGKKHRSQASKEYLHVRGVLSGMQAVFTMNVNCAVILNSQLARNFSQTLGLPFFPALPKLPSSSHHASVPHKWAGTSALPCPCSLPVEAILPWKGRQLPKLFPSSLGVHRSDSEPQGGPRKWYLMHSLPWPFCCSCPVDCVCR